MGLAWKKRQDVMFTSILMGFLQALARKIILQDKDSPKIALSSSYGIIGLNIKAANRRNKGLASCGGLASTPWRPQSAFSCLLPDWFSGVEEHGALTLFRRHWLSTVSIHNRQAHTQFLAPTLWYALIPFLPFARIIPI